MKSKEENKAKERNTKNKKSKERFKKENTNKNDKEECAKRNKNFMYVFLSKLFSKVFIIIDR